MNFKSAKELLKLCETHQESIAAIMIQREIDYTEIPLEEVLKKMERALEIMDQSCHAPTHTPTTSMGGLIGGEAAKLSAHHELGKSITGSILSKAITYSMAVLEVNASMGLIVAAPTAGSSGIVPGIMFALSESYDLPKEVLLDGLFTASAVGYLAMRNATVAGAVGGCQAEVGVASAMASATAVVLMGGTPKQALDAASMSMMNLLGLVCDPVAGLVEAPCQSRNATGVANAITCAEIILSGVPQLIPFDEMLAAMYRVGLKLPMELRETALGGSAATPTGCSLACGGCSSF